MPLVRNTLLRAAALLALAGTAFGSLSLPAAAKTQAGTITVNAHGVDLNDLVALIADQAGINIIVDGSVPTRAVTLRLKNVTLKTALQTIEHAYGLQEVWEDRVLHIGTPDVISREFPAAANSAIEQQVFPVTNADPDFVGRSLQSVLPPGTIVLDDPRSNTIFVKGDPNAIATAAQIIHTLDIPRYNDAAYSTVSVPLSNLKASDALALLRSQLPAASNAMSTQNVTASDHPNAIIATGSPDYIAEVKGILFNLDKPGKQVRFEVRVTDITPISDSSNIGVQWGINPVGGPNNNLGKALTTFLNGTQMINAQINLLKTQGHAEILAEPSITTMDNEKATLNVGSQYPIVFYNPQTGQNQVQFINAGVDLTVTPIIGQDNTVTVNLDTDYSQILGFQSNYPIVGQRHVTNVLRVPDGQTIVIAGLFSDIRSETIQKVPFLADIPIIGQVFRNRVTSHTRDEIVFLITPHVISANDFHPVSDIPANP